MTIEEIINSNVKITEKMGMLSEYEENMKESINKARKTILTGYKRCPICNEYYRKNSFERVSLNETREILLSKPIYEFDEWSSSEVEGLAIYDVCPLGHRIEVDFIKNKIHNK